MPDSGLQSKHVAELGIRASHLDCQSDSMYTETVSVIRGNYFGPHYLDWALGVY